MSHNGRHRASPTQRRSVLRPVSIVAAAAVGITLISTSVLNAKTPTDLYVSPTGSDSAVGETSAHPYQTIQAALDHASPGTTIHLAPGAYRETPVTKVNGTSSRRITIEGSYPGFGNEAPSKTILYGAGHVFTINNSYYRLKGFTIDGEPAIPAASYPSALAPVQAFKNSVQNVAVDSTLIFIGAATSARGLKGNIIDDMALRDAGSDCVRIRADATDNEVIDSTIQWCGIFSVSRGAGTFAYHNGEGVYIGTSPKSTDQPTYADDTSNHNIVRDNVIRTFGSECFDVKEHAYANVFEDNTCADNDEPLADDGSNVELRGYDNEVIDNTISDSEGYGLKLAADSAQDPQGGNLVEGNRFSGDLGAAITNTQSTAQGRFCGNTFTMVSYLEGRPVGDATKACTG